MGKSGKREMPCGGSRMHVYSLGAQNIKKVSGPQKQSLEKIDKKHTNLTDSGDRGQPDLQSSLRTSPGTKELVGQLSSMLTKPKATDKIRRQPGCPWTSSYPKATSAYLGT
ncbi:unnamed protein product [Prunus armeniaca]